MGLSGAQTYLADILHVISQALLIPVIAVLILLIAYALFSVGSVISEYFNERKHFKVSMPSFLNELMRATEEEIPNVVKRSGLITRQKVALLTAYDYRLLEGDAFTGLLKRLLYNEEDNYSRISARNNMVARVAPMIGLMGTLIPLGPGIDALGRADTAALSSSLLVAFDTTVAGLVVAAVCMIVGKIRERWYDNYLSALETAMGSLCQKVEDMREQGLITIDKPTEYALAYERSLDSRSRRRLDGGGRSDAGSLNEVVTQAAAERGEDAGK